MRARTLSLPAGTMPEALFQIAQHDTPGLVLQPRYMHHANGARRLVDVILCVENITEAVSRYRAIADAPVRYGSATARIAFGHADILITDPSGLADLIPDPQIPAMPFPANLTSGRPLHGASIFPASEDRRAEFRRSGDWPERCRQQLYPVCGPCQGPCHPLRYPTTRRVVSSISASVAGVATIF